MSELAKARLAVAGIVLGSIAFWIGSGYLLAWMGWH